MYYALVLNKLFTCETGNKSFLSNLAALKITSISSLDLPVANGWDEEGKSSIVVSLIFGTIQKQNTHIYQQANRYSFPPNGWEFMQLYVS